MFPVRRIYCIGRNYAAHAREMGSDPTREPPFFFQKPTDAIQNVAPGTVADHPYPTLTKNYHYEVELVAALNKGGRNIPIDRALELRLRLRRRARHDAARPAARDGRREEAVGDRQELRHVGADRSVASGGATGHFAKGAIWLKVNGQTKQNANLNQMIWNVAEQISSCPRRSSCSPATSSIPARRRTSVRWCKGDMIECHIDGLPNLASRSSSDCNRRAVCNRRVHDYFLASDVAHPTPAEAAHGSVHLLSLVKME